MRSDVRLVLAMDECDVGPVVVCYIMCMYSLCIDKRERERERERERYGGEP